MGVPGTSWKPRFIMASCGKKFLAAVAVVALHSESKFCLYGTERRETVRRSSTLRFYLHTTEICVRYATKIMFLRGKGGLLFTCVLLRRKII